MNERTALAIGREVDLWKKEDWKKLFAEHEASSQHMMLLYHPTRPSIQPLYDNNKKTNIEVVAAVVVMIMMIDSRDRRPDVLPSC
jgi:hypothetical protein